LTASLYRDQRVLTRPGRTASGRRAARARTAGRRRRWPAPQPTGPQRFLAVVIAAGCALCCSWYVRQVATADRSVLTGAVTSTGVLDLNFAAPGVVARVLVHVGQQVRRNQLLATESAPGSAAIETADAAAVAADKQQLGAEAGGVASVAAIRAQLARDEARLAIDEQAAAQRRIFAPAAGVITAVDAQPGQSAAPGGIRDLIGQQSPVDPPPLFSLLPKSPQVGTKSGLGSVAAMPAIQLRTSRSWQVLMLVPEGSAASVRGGQPVRVSVPAAGLSAVPGVVEQLLATPVITADGGMYEAVVTVGSRQDPPLDGMTANILLTSAGR
jgi:multidrug efflux pump subunit AcrA (membrane-fusion protein)